MARPKKTGLDYFPFDVDAFEDEKMVCIAGEFGIKGEITAIKLLCAVYKNGYFILWNEAVKMKMLRQLPGISSELFDQILNRLLRWGYFCRSLFESDKILTSEAIQRRYFEIAKNRSEAETEYPYLLIEKPNFRVFRRETPVSRRETPISLRESTQIKGKEIKKEKNKNKKENVVEVAKASTVEKIVSDFIERHQKSLEAFCMQNSITRSEFSEFMLEILTEWELSGWNPHPIKKGRGDYESFHFLNTMRIKINERKKRKNEADKTDRLQRRRGGDSTAKTRESFDATL